MKTAIQELIEFIDDKFIVSNSPQISSIYYKVQELLEKEKELACQFAKEYINGASYDTLGDYYDEKFDEI
jgi:hypothetical protein